MFLAFDFAASIDLAHAQRLMDHQATRPNLSSRFRAPGFIAYEPAPLRVTNACAKLAVGEWSIAHSVDITLFDFGAASVAYRIAFDCPMERLAALADLLQDHEGLREDARDRVLTLSQSIAPAVQRADMARPVEDYAAFVIDPDCLAGDAQAALLENSAKIAHILRGSGREGGGDLSESEVKEAMSARLTFTTRDAVVIDWAAAVLIDREPGDVLAILEFATIELLEMRLLDDRLDLTLAASYDTLNRQRWWARLLMGGSRDLRRLAAMQTDAALMFEGVNNAIKLVGDQYLARLYRAAASRMGVPEWQSSVRRKLATLESIHSKVADHGATFRLEFLEWIVVLLILFEVIMSFVRG